MRADVNGTNTLLNKNGILRDRAHDLVERTTASLIFGMSSSLMIFFLRYGINNSANLTYVLSFSTTQTAFEMASTTEVMYVTIFQCIRNENGSWGPRCTKT